MPRPLGAVALTTLLVCTALAGGAPAGAREHRPATPGPAPVRLDQPLQGRAAVRTLGDRLPAVARVNGRSAAAVRHLLLTDRTVSVSPTGGLAYADPAPAGRPAPAAVPAATRPLASTFALHSLPGSTHTIYLDFTGATVAGTVWNTSGYGLAGTFRPAWDPAGDGAAFSDSEQRKVQAVWAQVAEDYAPFDVDVTTEDPGAAALDRTSAADPTWGTRVLVTPSSQAERALCGVTCGGLAFLDKIDHYPSSSDLRSHDAYQPAWVFPQSLGQDVKAVAEAAAHEAGHTLGLEHDGTRASAYDEGHGAWAPIMGAGYYRPITQFSHGDYSHASNPRQDDVATVRRVLGARSDDGEGSRLADAAPPPTGTAYITARDDVDVYDLGACTGDLKVTATPASVAPDLDISLTVQRADGTVVARANPRSAMVNARTATGLAATATVSSKRRVSYVVRVDGVGHGTAVTGYTDYASLGAYRLRAGCTAARP